MSEADNPLLVAAIEAAVKEYRSAEAAYQTQAFVSTLAAGGFVINWRDRPTTPTPPPHG